MLKLDEMKIEITGLTPMIIHNGRTANPLDSYSKQLKALTSKRNKTDEDLAQILEVQWEAGLYWDEDLGLYMPSENLFAAFLKAARKHKLGPKCGGISFINPIGYPIITNHHKNFQKLKEDQNNKFVKTVCIQRSKTLSCRPIFNQWEMAFDLEFEADIIDANDIKTILISMASRVGFGVWTPSSPKPGTHGKFLINSLTWLNGKTGENKKIIGVANV